ncbi:hypothetical protein G7Y89_g4078 [Cudoniella acicularis]|uniref:Uncharacterized protein n=1 Tax=Cudoniella acicularis TaxID=354080 RepID=A0A8H4RS88_9HELO|nr:hypothetical protein G7Y89_g4078 [Cudoniella acicularis]
MASQLPLEQAPSFDATDFEFERHIDRLFDNLTKNFEDEEWRTLFTNYLKDHKDIVEKLEDISSAIKDAKAATPLADFSAESDIEELLKPIHHWEYTIIWEIKQKCTSIICKVIRDDRYGAKIKALEALYQMANRIAHLKDESGANIFHMIPLAATHLVEGIRRIGKELNEEQVKSLRQDKDFLGRLQHVRQARTKDGLQPFRGLDAFFEIFEDASIPIDFSQCLVEIETALAREPLSHKVCNPPDFLFDGKTPHPSTTMPDYVFETCIKHTIATKVGRRSCYATKLNAVRVLAKIGLQMLDAIDGGPHRDACQRKWYFLEQFWIDKMLEICRLNAVMSPEPKLTEDSLLLADLILLTDRKGYRNPETVLYLKSLQTGFYYLDSNDSDESEAASSWNGTDESDDSGDSDESDD